MDNVRSAASVATHTVAETLDPSASNDSLGSGAKSREEKKIKEGYAKDAHGNVSEKGSYKDQLNTAALEGREGLLAMHTKDGSITDTGMSVFPPSIRFLQVKQCNVGVCNDTGSREVFVDEPSWLFKACAYVPGVNAVREAIYGRDGGEENKKNALEDNGTPPTRPDHDTQVEEFLKSQYHSGSGDRMPDVWHGGFASIVTVMIVFVRTGRR